MITNNQDHSDYLIVYFNKLTFRSFFVRLNWYFFQEMKDRECFSTKIGRVEVFWNVKVKNTIIWL